MRERESVAHSRLILLIYYLRIFNYRHTHSSHSTGETWMIWSTNLRSWKKKLFELFSYKRWPIIARVPEYFQIDLLMFWKVKLYICAWDRFLWSDRIITLYMDMSWIIQRLSLSTQTITLTPLHFTIGFWLLLLRWTHIPWWRHKTQRKTIKNNATFWIATLIFLWASQSQFTTILAADIWRLSASLFHHNRNENDERHTHIEIEKEKNEIQRRIPKKNCLVFSVCNNNSFLQSLKRGVNELEPNIMCNWKECQLTKTKKKYFFSVAFHVRFRWFLIHCFFFCLLI